MDGELCFLPATELAQRIRRKDLSARELMQATLVQIERLNPRLNAIVTLRAEQAMAQAAAADEKQAKGEALAPLHGLPVNQVPPFDVNQPYVTEINGVTMGTYIDWMKSCYFITVTGHPAISVPCGFTPEGLPVGVQIVGRHQDDFGVLQLAYAFEQATQLWKRRPAIAL